MFSANNSIGNKMRCSLLLFLLVAILLPREILAKRTKIRGGGDGGSDGNIGYLYGFLVCLVIGLAVFCNEKRKCRHAKREMYKDVLPWNTVVESVKDEVRGGGDNNNNETTTPTMDAGDITTTTTQAIIAQPPNGAYLASYRYDKQGRPNGTLDLVFHESERGWEISGKGTDKTMDGKSVAFAITEGFVNHAGIAYWISMEGNIGLLTSGKFETVDNNNNNKDLVFTGWYRADGEIMDETKRTGKYEMMKHASTVQAEPTEHTEP